METEETKTVGDKLEELQKKLDQLREALGVNTLVENPENERTCLKGRVHPMFGLNVFKIHREWKEDVESITNAMNHLREKVKAYNEGDIRAVFKKLLNTYKETVQTRGILGRTRDTLEKCQQRLKEIVAQSGIRKSDHMVDTLKRIAKSVGLQCFTERVAMKDGSEKIAVTINGSIIVIDIEISSSGIVTLLKVSYASEINSDERVDFALLESLQKENSKLFAENLYQLAFLDKMTIQYSDANIFHLWKCLDSDLRAIFNLEQAGTANMASLLYEGHGILLVDKRITPQVIYFAVPTIASQINQDYNVQLSDNKQGVYYASFSVDDSPTQVYMLGSTDKCYLLSDESMISDKILVVQSPVCNRPMSFHSPTEIDGKKVPVCFYIALTPSLPVTVSVARLLYTSLRGTYADPASKDSESHLSQQYPDLLQILCKRKMKDDGHCFSCSTCIKSSKQKYVLQKKKTPTVTIERIPYTNPAQILTIYNLLRQQTVFNHLMESIMNDSIQEQEEEFENKSEKEECVFEMVFEAPSYISLTFVHPYAPELSTLKLMIGENGKITARGYGLNELDMEDIVKRLWLRLSLPDLMDFIIRDLANPNSNLELNSIHEDESLPKRRRK